MITIPQVNNLVFKLANEIATCPTCGDNCVHPFKGGKRALVSQIVDKGWDAWGIDGDEELDTLWTLVDMNVGRWSIGNARFY